MQWQMNALSNCGLLSRFLGMLTDSRSFMSYPRHEYFRRVLCDMIGRDIEAGEIPKTTAWSVRWSGISATGTRRTSWDWTSERLATNAHE